VAGIAGSDLRRIRLHLLFLLIAALGGAAVTAQGATSGAALERLLPSRVAGYTLVHFDHQDALHPRRRCPARANPFAGCLRDAHTAGSHPGADRPSIMIRVVGLHFAVTEGGLQRHLSRAVGPLVARGEAGGRRIFTRTALGVSYAAALMSPRTAVVAVAERHGRSASGARLAREAIRVTLARDPAEPGPRRRVVGRRPQSGAAGPGAADTARRAFDRCVSAPDGSELPVCPASPQYVFLDAFVNGIDDVKLEYDDCRGRPQTIFLCAYNTDPCPGRARSVYPAIFAVDLDRYSGWLSCSDIEEIPYWATWRLNASCDWVRRLEGTIARSLTATVKARGTFLPNSDERYGHGFWYDRSRGDLAFPAVQWDHKSPDDEDWYAFHNYGGTPVGPRSARLYAACANP
jgi:hypothetical protein